MTREAEALLRDKNKILVFTGSGLSTASGIPTFSDKEDSLMDYGISRWNGDPDWREEFWRLVFEEYWAAEPNAGHKAIERLVQACKAIHVTSNIDGLTPAIEVCGSVRRIRCTECLRAPGIRGVRDSWLENRQRPTVTGPLTCACGGTLRPDVVFIGETFQIEPLNRAEQATEDSDAMLLVGASDLIGMWELPLVWHVENELPVVVVNPEPPSMQAEFADVLIEGQAEVVLPKLVDGILR